MTAPDLNQEARPVIAPSTLPSVNLMPSEIAAAARFRRFQLCMGAAVVGAVVVVGALYVHGKSAVSDARAQVAQAQQEQASVQQELTSLHSVSDVYAQVAAKQAMLHQAMGSEVDWSTYLSDLSLRVPDNVWLSNLQATQSDTGLTGPAGPAQPGTLAPTGIGTLTFAGVAFSHDDVATWLDVLAKEKGFANAYFSNSTKATIGKKPVVNFTSSVTVTDQAKSNRFTNPAGN
jgi:Tfp pilus assembly protein PilN